MGIRLQNLASLFSNARSRAIIIFTGLLLIIAIVIGYFKLRTPAPPSPAAAAVATPPTVENIPGGFVRPESPEYARLQAQQNIQQAKEAKRTGKSAIPTLISSSTLANQGFAEPPQAAAAPVSCVAPGTAVFDADCKNIGTVGRDNVVRTPTGTVFGQQLTLAKNTPGALVYGPNGNVIGTVGKDGLVRDANGRIIGAVDADGNVRSPDGQLIGKTGAAFAGSPVYDSDGKLIGTVGPDGTVRNAQGQVVGQVGADGVVRNAQGQVIGHAIPTAAGQMVYGADGKPIGVVGPDGKVYNSRGQLIGTVGPDGKVHDLSGKEIGQVAPFLAGAKAFDASGRPLGTVLPNGDVVDGQGHVIGHVGPDGLVRDSAGNIIGKVPTGTVPSGVTGPTNAFDNTGKLLGNIDENGVFHPAAGLGPTVAQGAPTSALPTAPGAGGPTNLQAIAARQAQEAAVAQNMQLKNQLQGLMAGQASQLIAAWAPPTQSLVAGTGAPPAPAAQAVPGLTYGPTGAVTSGLKGPVIKAGTIMFAVLQTAVNTDEPGPILAHIVSGQLKGAKIMGSLVNQGQNVMLNFNILSVANFDHTIAINAVAIDPNTARTAISSYTDNHYLLRYGSLFASSFLSGYANAISQSGSTVISNGFNVQKNMPNLSPSGELVVALGNVGSTYAAIANYFNTPPTVHVYSGTGIGLLFTQDAQLPE